jgi:hypothetical protein
MPNAPPDRPLRVIHLQIRGRIDPHEHACPMARHARHGLGRLARAFSFYWAQPNLEIDDGVGPALTCLQ